MYPRARNVAGVTVLVALAVVTWLFSRPPADETPAPGRGEDTSAAYYLRDATMLGTNADGRVYYRMIADEIEQSVGGDELLFHGLRIEYEPSFEINWSLSAAEGRAERGEDVLNLSAGVLLQNTTAPNGEATVVRTASLSLDTAQSMATTAESVVLSRGRTTFRAVGLTADLARDQLRLHSGVLADVVP